MSLRKTNIIIKRLQKKFLVSRCLNLSKHLYILCNVLTLESYYDLRRLMFMSKLRYLQHDVIANLLPLFLTADDLNDLFCTYDVTMYSTQCCIDSSI